MKRSVFAALLAVVAVALAAKPTGAGVLPNTPATASVENLVKSEPWHGQSCLQLSEVRIDTGTIVATAADYEMDGTMWVAYSNSNTQRVYLARSTDHGATWQGVMAMSTVPLALVTHLGLVVTPGDLADSAFAYVFLIHPDNNGDMLCVRVEKDGSNFVTSLVHGGPEVINNFRVCRDYDIPPYWLYCIAGDDDHVHPDLDDFLMRSTDYGKTWTKLNDLEFFSDGSIAAGAGTYLYIAGYVGGAAQGSKGVLDLAVNSFRGSPGYWTERPVMVDTFPVKDPVIAPSFVLPEQDAVIWTLYSHDFNGSGDWDMLYVYSTDAGASWNGPERMSGDGDVSEVCGDIKPFTEPGNTRVDASFIYEQPADWGVYRRDGEQANPTTWSPKLRININHAQPDQSVRPLLVYSPGGPSDHAGCVFVGPVYKNVYFNAPWLPGVAEEASAKLEAGFSVAPNPAGENVRFALPRVAGARVVVYDAAGREVLRLPADADFSWDRTDARGDRVPAGVYIVRLVAPERSVSRRLVLR
jgi:hypothetical protein